MIPAALFRSLLAISFALSIWIGTGVTLSANASWAFGLVVWNGHTYKVDLSEQITNVGQEIGEVTYYTDQEGTYAGNFSNEFPVGTKYFEIQGTPTSQEIAVKTPDGFYVQATENSVYPGTTASVKTLGSGPGPNFAVLFQQLFWGVIGFLVVIILASWLLSKSGKGSEK